jgi:hypothetical protein
MPARVRGLQVPRRTLPIAAGVVIAAGAVAIALGAGDVERRWENFKDPVVFQGDVSTDEIESRFLSGSGNGRYQYWTASVDAFESKPVGGRGAGTWDFWWRRNATSGGTVRDSHSLFSDVIAELGIFGTLTLVAMFGCVLAVGIGAWRRSTGSDRLLATVLLTIAATFTFHAAIDWIWELAAIGVVFFAAAGLLVWVAPGRGFIPARRATTAGVVIAGVAWLAIFAEAIPLLSNWKLEQSRAAARDGDLDRALKSANAAHTIEPWAGEPRLQIAQVREEMATDQAALNAAGDAVRNEPTNWETWFVLARIEAKAGQREAAEEHLREARRLNPLSPIWQQIDGADALAGG